MILDPKLDLKIERVIDVPPELVWMVWTTPEHMLPWFCPKPWQTVRCEIDLVPGGRFHTVMRSPEGQDYPNDGCYLEIVPNRRLVWTSALAPGFRPVAQKPKNPGKECDDLLMTAFLLLEPHGKGTKYTAIAKHMDEAHAQRHEAMGFSQGWGACLDQLVEYVKALK